MEFKRIRDAHISESAAETNRLVIRLEKVEEQRERLGLANKSTGLFITLLRACCCFFSQLFRMLKDDTPSNRKQLKGTITDRNDLLSLTFTLCCHLVGLCEAERK